MSDHWFELLEYLRSKSPERDQRYLQLCDQPRIAQELVQLRRRNTPSTQPR